MGGRNGLKNYSSLLRRFSGGEYNHDGVDMVSERRHRRLIGVDAATGTGEEEEPDESSRGGVPRKKIMLLTKKNKK